MKKSTLLTAILLIGLVAVPASGQWTEVSHTWELSAVLDSASWPQYSVVDDQGRIWVGDYYDGIDVLDHFGNLHAIIDSFKAPHPDAAVGDTSIPALYCRGMALAANGDVIFAKWGAIVVVDPDSVTATDGSGLYVPAKAFIPFRALGDEQSPMGPAVDGDGYIYVGYVVGTDPIVVYDPTTFAETQAITLTGAGGYARGLAVSSDATALYMSDLGAAAPLRIFTSTNFVDYTLTDSVYKDGLDSLIFYDQKVCMHWGPGGKLWVGVDDYEVTTDSLHNNMTVLDFDNEEYFRIYHPDALIDTTANPDYAETEYGKGFRGVSFSADNAFAFVQGNDQGATYIFHDVTLIVDEQSPGIPDGYALAQNYPNPFNPNTRIAYEIPNAEFVSLDVYNLLGEKVRTLVNGMQTAGVHHVMWDGTTDNGVPVATGMYVYRMKAAGHSITKTMLLIK
ncbi:MAG: T9SS type A sorting domain-containing protein [Fidelibacterota bacterium]|nr:MAG: T9SS type A sorting domain-containing protein [Candidatus Neomarinimicrobiota bacterium]